MVMPNLLILGAPKSGTTTLHYVLDQHPEIYMSSIKEPGFLWAYGEALDLKGPSALLLKHRVVQDLDQYQQLFVGVTTQKVIGESSASYMFHPRSPRLIRQFIPQTKFLVILRHPAERAFSSFTQYLRDGVEPCSDFAAAIAEERQGLRDHWTFGHHLRYGFYYAALKRYLEDFEWSQFYVSLFDDLKNDPTALMVRIFDFLGVDKAFKPDLSQQHNVSGVIANPVLRFFWTRSNRLRAWIRPLISQRMRHGFSEWVFRATKRQSLSPELRAELTGYYRQDIEQLQDLLQRDLSHWLEV